MALTEFQRSLCRLLASNEAAGRESYVAGGVALNETLAAPRISRDLDLFHDTQEALNATWQADRVLLEQSGYNVGILRERPGYVEALIEKGGGSVEVQWMRDSAFRFFPLAPHDDLGFTLHPFDLATNKVLALVGRVEVRDWIDTLTCNERVTPLGLLAWAACGKDEGWNPQLIVDEAARTAHYSREETLELHWDGPAPDFALLKTLWREALADARIIIETLPPEEAGKAVLDSQGNPLRGESAEIREILNEGRLQFHPGHIGGAWPRLKI